MSLSVELNAFLKKQKSQLSIFHGQTYIISETNKKNYGQDNRQTYKDVKVYFSQCVLPVANERYVLEFRTNMEE